SSAALVRQRLVRVPAQDGQLLLPMLDLIEDAQLAIDDLIDVMGRATYKRQYGLDSIHLILTNLYGPGDSYNPERSHVVAALVRKFVEAEMAKAPTVEVWGTGKPVREFLYVEDCADAIVLAAEKYDDCATPLNIGTGVGTTIRELSDAVCAASGYQGKMVWNAD